MKRRHRSATVNAADQALLEPIQTLKAKHPAWGYRRIWGIDMTKIMIQSWGWVYLVVVLDWGSKKVVGWDLSLTSKTSDWLAALDKALNQQFPHGLSDNNSLQLVSDNGSQPTSTRFVSSCSLLGLQQIFTSYCNPKYNAETERLFSTLKEDLIWLQDWLSVEQLRSSLTPWFHNYNEDFPHSTLGYLTPSQFEQHYREKFINKYSLTFSCLNRGHYIMPTPLSRSDQKHPYHLRLQSE